MRANKIVLNLLPIWPCTQRQWHRKLTWSFSFNVFQDWKRKFPSSRENKNENWKTFSRDGACSFFPFHSVTSKDHSFSYFKEAKVKKRVFLGFSDKTNSSYSMRFSAFVLQIVVKIPLYCQLQQLIIAEVGISSSCHFLTRVRSVSLSFQSTTHFLHSNGASLIQSPVLSSCHKVSLLLSQGRVEV